MWVARNWLTAFWCSLVITSGFSLIKSYRSETQPWDNLFWLRQLASTIQAELADDSAWEQTLNLDQKLYPGRPNFENFRCLREHTDCRGKGGSFLFVDRRASPQRWTSDPLDPGRGLNLTGQVCRHFPSSYGENDYCPVRVDLSWTPRCPSAGICIDPEIVVNGVLKVTMRYAAGFLPLNPFAYSFSIEKKSQRVATKDICLRMGFRYEDSDKSCRLRSVTHLSASCPSGSLLVGLSEAAEGICKDAVLGMGDAKCPSGYFLKGVDTAGGVHCGTIHCVLGWAVPAESIVNRASTGPSEQLCLNAAGSFDPSRGQCRVGRSGICPYGVILSLSVDQKICGLPWSGVCAAGSVAQTLNVNGRLVCIPLSCEGTYNQSESHTLAQGLLTPFLSEPWFEKNAAP